MQHIHISKKDFVRYLLLLGVLVAYFIYLSIEYGLATGGIVAGLTWSFFVLCTPVADAGFLVDFPVRLIVGLRMAYSECLVWAIAISLNLIAFFFFPDSYNKSFITDLLYKILATPWPYWSIIALCATGTFLSVWFGDEIYDKISKKNQDLDKKFWLQIVVIIITFLSIIAVYYHLISALGIEYDTIAG